MAIKLEKKANGLMEMHVDLAPEAFVEALKQAYKRSARRFNVPGFRKGKAPYALAMRHYGEAVLYDDAIDLALAPVFQEAVEKEKLNPVDRPDLQIEEIGSEKGLRAVLQIPVYPDVKLGDYFGVEAEQPSAEVTDAEVEAELTRVRERSGRMVPVEGRAAESGDTARIDFEGFLGDTPFDGGKGEGHDLVLGSQSFIPGFEDQVIGHNPGESFDVNVAFPADYHAKELAGQEARFAVTLHSLKRKELPALDDEFAKDVSECDTLEEYRNELRAGLEKRARERAEQQFAHNVVEAVVANAEVEIPARMIDREVDQNLAEQERRMQYQGIQLNQYLQYIGKTLDEVRKEMRPSAEHSVRTMLVLHAVAEAEGIEVTAEDRRREHETLAAQYGLKPEEVAERMGEGAEVTRLMRNEKTRKLLCEKAKPLTPAEAAKKAAKAEKAAKKAAKQAAESAEA